MAHSLRPDSIASLGFDYPLKLLEGSLLGRVTHVLLAAALLWVLAHVAHAQSAPDADVPPERFDHHVVVRIHPRSTREMRTALALTDDVWSCGFSGDAATPDLTPASIDIHLTPEAHQALIDAGVPHTLLIADIQKLIDAERPSLLSPRGPGTFFTAFQDYASVSSYVNTLVGLRPDMASRLSVGNSLAPREIFGIRIGAPNSDPGSRPAIVLYSCQHAREWITVMSGMYIADQLVRNYAGDPAIRRLLDNYEFYIIPISNPDGYVHTWTTSRLWRKNRRVNADGTIGVDLNRNWGYQWGGAGSSSVTSSDTYRGTAAFSEPCTVALRNFITARPNTVLSVDLHSYAQVVLEPWGYSFELPPDTRTFAQMTSAIQAAMSASAGGYFVGGETYRTLYPVSGGSHDWAYGARGILAFGFELRDRGNYGFVPPPSEIIPGAQEAAAGVFAAANWLLDHACTVTFPEGQPAWLKSAVATPVRVQFTKGTKALPALSGFQPTVFARIGRNGSFASSAVALEGTDETGRVFTHALTAGPCSSVVQWYYTVPLADGSVATVPPAGAAAPFEAAVVTATTVFSDTFETSLGWTVGDATAGSPDTATTGIWVRADPNGTSAQPEYDHTPLTGVSCYITGQNVRGDVNGGRVGVGKTTLTSPLFSAPASARLDASFWLWSMTSQVETFTVDVSANASAGSPTWVRALTIDASSPNWQTTPRWNRYTIRLSDLVAPGNAMKLRFIARATGPNNIVEIALDDLAITSFSCDRSPCVADYNADGGTSIEDLFDFLNDWFVANPRAILHGTWSVNDIFEFIGAWFSGCQ